MVTHDVSEAAAPAGRPAPPRQGPFTRWPHTADTALAVLVFVLEVVGALIRQANESGEFSAAMLGDVPPGIYLLLGVSSVALVWRRSHPLAVLVTTLAASVVWDVMSLDGGPSLAIFVSLYGIGRYITDTRTSLIAVAAAVILAVADDVIEGEPMSVFGFSLSVVVLGWYVGRRVRGRGEYLRLLEERTAYLERERHAAARLAVDEERARIARELHDVVAHRVSMITVQAGAAQTVASSDPERAIRAMKAVEEAGREALGELRQVLGVLRSDEQREDLVPIHGLADIPGLVAEMKRAGLDVSLSSDGVPDSLPARLDLASYRIVQEALTNVLKHAGPAPGADVRLSADGDTLTIEVIDRGSGASTLPGAGQGLVGMRERAALLGGTFEAGPRVGGGFRVMARLPIEDGQA